MTRARLSLLGSFVARTADGTVAKLGTRKAEALISALACRLGEPQPRERLTALLWGERGDAQARHSLSQALVAIRAAFDDPGLLIAERESVALSPDAVDVDVVTLQRLAASESPAQLRAAADLYRGPLLDGLLLREPAFEEWLTQERAELHRLALAVMTGLAQREAALGECDAAAATLERALALDPLCEPTHRRLIRLHLDQGATNAAIRSFRACAEILKRELGTAPEPATIALYNEAMRGAGRAKAAVAPGNGAAPAGPAPNGQSTALDALLSRPAVAVFPFDSLGDDPAQGYFADGITEDIIAGLSCWRVFPVIARNSSFAYRGKGTGVAKAARELGARYALHGSVRKSAGRVRITAQLLDANDATHLWNQRYDRDLDDVFAVQDEISLAIVESIEPQLSRAELRRALRKRPESLDAWDLTLRALAHLRGFDKDGTTEARRLLDRAIALDPSSSYAHSLLALSHFRDALGDFTREPPERLAATFAAARKAVALDDEDWLSHALYGIALMWTRREHDLAQEELERAVALNPSAALAHQLLGTVRAFAGAAAAAIAPLETVLRLDPRYQTPALILADLALAHLVLGDSDAAVGLSQRAIQRGQCNIRAYQRLTASLGHRGPRAEAAEALDALLRLQPQLSQRYIAATYPFRDSDHLALFVDGLRRAGWRDSPRASRASGG